jgi:hypothetical protein
MDQAGFKHSIQGAAAPRASIGKSLTSCDGQVSSRPATPVKQL